MKRGLINLILIWVAGLSGVYAAEIRGIVVCSTGGLGDSVVYIERIEGKSFPPPREPVVLNQKGLRFIPHVLPVIAGTTVNFPNEDVVLHNVFSPGYIERFNLGTYPQGSSKEKRFDIPGVVLLLCNIHHEMSAFLVIVETPYFAVADGEGSYKIDNVPPGRYKLVAWHERMPLQAKEIEVRDHGEITINFLMER